MKKSLAAAVFGLVLALAAYVGSPFWTVHQMRSAAKDRDGERLARHIDFPAVREGFKSQLAASLTRKSRDRESDTPLDRLGQALVRGMVGSVVDAVVTPEAMVLLMAEAKPPSPERAPRAPRRDSDRSRPAEVETKVAFEGLDQVSVAIRRKGSDDPPTIATLSRRGFATWKMTALRLPIDDAPRDAGKGDRR